MGLGFEGPKGDRGMKGERGPPGLPIRSSSFEQNATMMIGPQGEPGEKGSQVPRFLYIYTFFKCMHVFVDR